MAKKNTRKPSGAAGIKVIDDDLENTTDNLRHETNGSRSDSEPSVSKPGRKVKAKAAQQSSEHVGVSDIKKAAAFANSRRAGQSHCCAANPEGRQGSAVA